ncbi:MAG TPA: RNA polymerase sigma factor [Rhizomicrobium sp.]|nr:RNA polymerase sigma factor [Rhizomicrobium sp.]
MDDDARLAHEAAAGNAAAFGHLVRLHQGKVRAFLRRMTHGNHALADDLSQDTFLEAHRKIAQYRGEGSFTGWLYRIAYTRFLMEVRKRKLEPLDGEDERGFETEPGLIAKLDLEKAMAKLSAAERAALTLCYALEFSNEEAALILSTPLGTLKSHVLRGREKLAKLLGTAPEAT